MITNDFDRDSVSAVADRFAAWLAIDPEDVNMEQPSKKLGTPGRICLLASEVAALMDLAKV
jgi:hypothetical protein